MLTSPDCGICRRDNIIPNCASERGRWVREGGGTKARSIISAVLQSGGKRREEMALQIFRMQVLHVRLRKGIEGGEQFCDASSKCNDNARFVKSELSASNYA